MHVEEITSHLTWHLARKATAGREQFCSILLSTTPLFCVDDHHTLCPSCSQPASSRMMLALPHLLSSDYLSRLTTFLTWEFSPLLLLSPHHVLLFQSGSLLMVNIAVMWLNIYCLQSWCLLEISCDTFLYEYESLNQILFPLSTSRFALPLCQIRFIPHFTPTSHLLIIGNTLASTIWFLWL